MLPNSNSLSAPNSNFSSISNVNNVSTVNDESINPIISSNVEIIANSNVNSSERNSNVNSSESISEENVINEQNTDNESNNEMQSKYVNIYDGVIGSQSCGGDLEEDEISMGEESATRKRALSELSSDSEDSVSSSSFAKPLSPRPSRGAMKVPIVKYRLVGTVLFPLSLRWAGAVLFPSPLLVPAVVRPLVYLVGTRCLPLWLLNPPLFVRNDEFSLLHFRVVIHHFY